jgi:hypothetical protein
MSETYQHLAWGSQHLCVSNSSAQTLELTNNNITAAKLCKLLATIKIAIESGNMDLIWKARIHSENRMTFIERKYKLAGNRSFASDSNKCSTQFFVVNGQGVVELPHVVIASLDLGVIKKSRIGSLNRSTTLRQWSLLHHSLSSHLRHY